MFATLSLLLVCMTAAYESAFNTTLKDDMIVQFQDVPLRSGNYPQGAVVAHSIYIRRQNMISHTIAAPSDIFTTIPGLMFAIHHAHPIVYRLEFQGTCKLSATGSNGFVRFLIDGRVLVSNYLLPNTAQRHSVAPELGKDLNEFDYRAGGMIYNSESLGIAMSCPKSDLIYMPAGTHVVEVAARARGNGGINVYGGELSVQLTQYDSAVNLELSHPIVR